EREVVGAARLVGERVADETVAGEGGKLEEPDRLRQPWIEHRRVPGRGPRQDPAPLGRFEAGRNPVGVRRDGLGRHAGASSTDDQDAHSCAAPPYAPEEFSPVHSLAKGYRAVGGHLGSPSVPVREGKDPCGYWPRVRRTCRVRTAKSSGISRTAVPRRLGRGVGYPAYERPGCMSCRISLCSCLMRPLTCAARASCSRVRIARTPSATLAFFCTSCSRRLAIRWS